MKKCECCDNEHDGAYGSGRFCCSYCARSFTTKAKRQQINLIVSKKLKGRKVGGSFKKGHDPNRKPFTYEEQLKGVGIRLKNLQELYKNGTWEQQPILEKRRRVITEQNSKCKKCKNHDWMGEKLIIEIHHVDGNNNNWARENLEGLCPNCHSQTPNYRNRKRI